MSDNVPSRPEPRHTVADVLSLVDRLRLLAYDTRVDAQDAMRRIR